MGLRKGQCNNRAGRPKNEDSAANAIREALTNDNWKAMAVALYNKVMDTEASGKDRAACYNALADRAFGKPVQKQINMEVPAPPIDSEQIKALQEAIGLPTFTQEESEDEDDTDDISCNNG